MTRFEGIVNGVKFDDVVKYNEALTTALQNGEPVEASTRTYQVPDRPVEPGREGVQVQTIDEKFFPNFNLDDLNGDDCNDTELIEELSQRICYAVECENELANLPTTTAIAITDRTKGHLKRLASNDAMASNAISKLDGDIESRMQTIADLKAEISDLEIKRNILVNGKTVIGALKRYYDHLIDYVSRNAERDEREPRVSGTQGVESTAVGGGLQRLINAIFNC